MLTNRSIPQSASATTCTHFLLDSCSPLPLSTHRSHFQQQSSHYNLIHIYDRTLHSTLAPHIHPSAPQHVRVTIMPDATSLPSASTAQQPTTITTTSSHRRQRRQTQHHRNHRLVMPSTYDMAGFIGIAALLLASLGNGKCCDFFRRVSHAPNPCKSATQYGWCVSWGEAECKSTCRNNNWMKCVQIPGNGKRICEEVRREYEKCEMIQTAHACSSENVNVYVLHCFFFCCIMGYVVCPTGSMMKSEGAGGFLHGLWLWDLNMEWYAHNIR